MTDLFIEIFPIEPTQLATVAAYRVSFKDARTAGLQGGRLAYRLTKTFPGRWVYADARLLTDTPVSQIEMDIALDILKTQVTDQFGGVISVEEDATWQTGAVAQAEFVLKTAGRDLDDAMRAALLKFPVQIKNAIAEREPVLQPWSIMGEPAVSISIRTHLRYPKTLAEHISETGDPEACIGWRVVDKTATTMIGTLTLRTGRLGQHRERLMSLTKREVMQNLLRNAPDDDPVFMVQTGDHQYEYAASTLYPMIGLNSEEMARFDVPAEQAFRSTRLRPDVRANLVQAASDVLKNAGIVGRAYSTRLRPECFAAVDFVPNLVYGGKRVFPYRPETLATDFGKGGMYQRHHRFDNAPIRIAVINALDESVDDFVEAMRRQLERAYGFTIEMIKERKVRVVSAENLKSAVRVVEKEKAHLVLAFFKDEATGDEEGETQGDALVKAQTLSKGIAAHIIYESTIHNPDAMPLVMMSVLAKTGSIPFALAEPLEYTDYVVGLGFVREQTKQGDRVTALSRIYRSDGVFVQYLMDTLELDRDEPVPFVLLQTLFPHELFEQKRVIIHHDGELAAETATLLTRWQQVLSAQFTLVEILRDNVPRLYGLADGKIIQPPWGSLFKVNDSEAFIVSSAPSPYATAQPLHVRVVDDSLPVESAVYSVLAWTLLYYGAARAPKLPVTIQHAEDIEAWLAKGMLPAEREGDVPFWL
jgi:hypothetical protein